MPEVVEQKTSRLRNNVTKPGADAPVEEECEGLADPTAPCASGGETLLAWGIGS